LPIAHFHLYGVAAWVATAIGFVALYVYAVVAYRHAHRRLFPELSRQRFESLTQLALFPPALPRAADLLVSSAFCDFHPLAIAAARGGVDILEPLLRQELARVDYPPWRGDPELDTAARQRFTSAYREALLGLADAVGVDRAALRSAPRRKSIDGGAYCPACMTEFRAGIARCAECDVDTIEYEPAG
jgi:hypothetical protein